MPENYGAEAMNDSTEQHRDEQHRDWPQAAACDAQRFAALQEQLLLRELDAEGERELHALAGDDVERAAELRASEQLLQDFAAERTLRREAAADLDAVDEGSAQLRALRAAAEAGEASLRAELLAERADAPRSWLRRAAAVAAAALFAMAAWLSMDGLSSGSSRGGAPSNGQPGVAPPQLLPGTPGDAVLGGRALLEVEPTLELDAGVIRFSAVPGAVRYAARLTPVRGGGGGGGGSRVEIAATDDLRAAGASPSWILDDAQQARLRAAATLPLEVEVTAYDGEGLPIVSSGPVAMRLVD